LIGLPLLLMAATQSAPPSFSAAVESVYVDAFVTDKKGPVTGLGAADFELRDNEVLQSVELVAVESVPLTTLLVLDTSGSVTGGKLERLQTAGYALLQRTRQADQVALLSFGQEIEVRVPATSDVRRVASSLAGLRAQGGTALYDALFAALMLAPEKGRSMVVLFTDGEDNMSVLGLRDVLRVLARANVVVQVVGIVSVARSASRAARPSSSAGGRDQDAAIGRQLEQTDMAQRQLGEGGPRFEESEQQRRLRLLAESTGGRFWPATAPESLALAFVSIAESMKTRYLLRFEPRGVAREGRHTLAIRLRRRGGSVHCRKTYFVADR
jgi:VWFA-related protein